MKEKRHFLKSALYAKVLPQAKKWGSRTTFSVLAVAILLGTLMPLFALINTAEALRGETFTWIDRDTIRIEGGDLARTVNVNPDSDSLYLFKGAGELSLKSGCKMTYRFQKLQVDNPKASDYSKMRFGTVDLDQRYDPGTGGYPPPTDRNKCLSDAGVRRDYGYFENDTSGSMGPGDGIEVTLRSPENALKAPGDGGGGTKLSYTGGETFRWVDEGTIQVSGPGLAATADLTGQSVGTGWSYHIFGTVTLASGCKLVINIFNVVADVNTGLIFTDKPSSGACTDPAVLAKYAYLDPEAHPEGPTDVAPPVTLQNPENAGKDKLGQMPPLPEGEDVADKQIVHVKLDTGWKSIYQGDDPEATPKQPGEEGYRTVPTADVFSICSLERYVNNNQAAEGTFNVRQAEEDCVAQKQEALTYRKRIPWNINGEVGGKNIIYEGDITGVKKGYYVVCSIVTHGCSLNSPETKLPGQILVVDKWKNPPDPFADVPGEVGSEIAPPRTACELSFNPTAERATSWLACPTHESINFVTKMLDSLINSNLQPDLTIFDKSGNGSSYHSAWNSFRVIALGFVVVAALIMVITQAAGLEVLDAYTVRKVLPRLLASAVFITISWDVLEVFFRLSDAATIGLRSLIYAPFTTLDPVQLGGGSAFSGLLLGGGALIAMGWIALLSFGLSALLAVALAFFILVLIKVALAGILIASPIFIAASILPGTSKLYEFGKGALISLLLAPVVVGALIALFRTGAVIAYNREDGNAAINQIIAILLYFGAYFAILKGLSAVGGFAATITGFVNDRGRGAFDRLKKFRGDKVKQNMADMRTGERFGEKTRFGRTLNRIGQNAMQVGDAGFGITRGSRLKHAGLRDVRGRAAGERAMKSEDMQALQYDDDGIAAMYLSGGRSARRARSELRRIHTNPDGTWHEGWNEQRVEKAVSTAQAVGITRSNAIAAGTLGAKNKFRSIGAGQDGIDTIDATARYIAGGDDQLAHNLSDDIKYAARSSGRTDLAYEDLDSSWGKSSMGELVGSTPVAMQAHMQAIAHDIRTGRQAEIEAAHQDANGNWHAGWDPNRVARQVAVNRQRAAIKLVEAHTVMSQGDNADSQAVINQTLTSLGYDGNRRTNTRVEDFAAGLAGLSGPGAGNAVRSQARTHDAQYSPGTYDVPVVVRVPAPQAPINRGGARQMGVGGNRPAPPPGGGPGGASPLNGPLPGSAPAGRRNNGGRGGSSGP